MSCLKTCGYVCGGLAALNIWFWIGMTVFNAMGNPWITKEIIGKENYTDDVSSFTTAFGLCILLNALCMVGCCGCTKAGCYQDKDKVVYYVPGRVVETEGSINANHNESLNHEEPRNDQLIR